MRTKIIDLVFLVLKIILTPFALIEFAVIFILNLIFESETIATYPLLIDKLWQ